MLKAFFSKLKNKKFLLFIFFTIIGYSVFLRLYNLGTQSFWIDEGFSSYSTLSWINLQYYLHNLSQLISFKTLGVSDFSARFPSIIFSIINIYFIYMISYKLFKDKKQAVLSTVIFCFLTWEIVWARQARFYTLLQLLFSINIYLLINIVKNFSYKYLNLAIVFLYIGFLFHPFLYANIFLFGLTIAYLIFLNRKKQFKYKKYIFTYILIIGILGIEFIKYLNLGEVNIYPTTELSEKLKEGYINYYSSILSFHLGILYVLFLLSFFIFAFKKKVLETIVFTIGFITLFFAISQKGNLIHSRYIFITFPLIIIGGVYSLFYLYSLIKNKKLGLLFLFIIIPAVFYTGKYTFLPQINYFIDKTSPQPNFNLAYKIIPKDSEVISGFPMLCEWYYSNKGVCKYSLAINYVGKHSLDSTILERGFDSYTNIKYLDSLDNLEENKDYYFVIDNLTYNGTIRKEIIQELLKNGDSIFRSGGDYNTIRVIRYKN